MSDTEGKSLAELEAKLAEAEDRLLEISTNLLRSEAEKDELVASLRRLEKEKDETEGGLTQMGRKINHLKGLEAKLKNDISNTNELYQAREKELEAKIAQNQEVLIEALGGLPARIRQEALERLLEALADFVPETPEEAPSLEDSTRGRLELVARPVEGGNTSSRGHLVKPGPDDEPEPKLPCEGVPNGGEELEAEPAEEVELEKQETPPTKPEVKPEVKASKPARSMEGWMSGLKRS